MTFDLRHSRESHLLPGDLARLFVQAVNDPLMTGLVRHRLNIAVQPDLELRVGLPTDSRGDEDLVSPDDWTRMAEAGDRCLPFHVLARRHVPLSRSWETLGNAAGI